MRFSSGTLTSTTPANLPASRTERLSSQVPPKSTTFSEIALTSPGLSSPTKVRTSDVVMGGGSLRQRVYPSYAAADPALLQNGRTLTLFRLGAIVAASRVKPENERPRRLCK